jgi:hypothetical protein
MVYLYLRAIVVFGCIDGLACVSQCEVGWAFDLSAIYLYTCLHPTTSVQMKRPALLHISIILLLDGRHNAMTVYA